MITGTAITAAALLSACGDDDAGSAALGAIEIDVIADDLAFEPDEVTITAGDDVAIELTSVDMVHDLTIDALDVEVVARSGDSATTGFRVEEPGRYTFYCDQPGHRQSGMEGTLTVEQSE